MRSECSKLAQREYKARHDRMEKVIHCELCKKLKFDHTTKFYMLKPGSVAQDLCDLKTQADHLIPTRRPDLMMINRKRKGEPAE